MTIVNSVSPAYSNEKTQALQLIKDSAQASEKDQNNFYTVDASGNMAGTSNAISIISDIVMNIAVDEVGSGLSAVSGDGDDTINIKTNGYIYGVNSAAGNDNLNITSTGQGQSYAGPSHLGAISVGKVDAGDGDDKINIVSNGQVSNVDSGSGNDSVQITTTGEGQTADSYGRAGPVGVSKINTGSGDDEVNITSRDIVMNVRTEAGDDTVKITATGGDHSASAYNPSGPIGVSAVYTGEGHDNLEISSRDSVRRIYTDSGNDIVQITVTGRDESLDKTEGMRNVGVDILQTGSGNDTVSVTSRETVSRVKTGSGNDTIDIKVTGTTYRQGEFSSSADGIDAGSGNDTMDLSALTVARIYGGDGHDTMNIKGNTVTSIYAGSGNDTLNISATDAAFIDGGNGNDTISINAERIQRVRGGSGNDTMILDSVDGNKTQIYLSEGDGRDYVEVNSELEIRFIDENSQHLLDPDTVKLSKNTDGSYVVHYGNQGDSVTVKFTGDMEGKEIRLNQGDPKFAKLELVDKDDPLSNHEYQARNLTTGELNDFGVASALKMIQFLKIFKEQG